MIPPGGGGICKFSYLVVNKWKVNTLFVSCLCFITMGSSSDNPIVTVIFLNVFPGVTSLMFSTESVISLGARAVIISPIQLFY